MLESELVSYMNHIKRRYSCNAEKVLLTKISAVFYPLFVANNMPRCGPILVRCKDIHQAEWIAKDLNPFKKNNPLSLSATPREMRRMMESGDYDVRLFLWQDGRYTKENLLQVHNAALYGEEPVLVLIVAVGDDVRDYSECFFGEIYLDGDEDDSNPGDEMIALDAQLVREQIVFALSRKAEIKQWTRNSGGETGLCMFRISKEILQNFCKCHSVGEEFLQKLENDLEMALSSIEEDWEGGNEAEDIAEAFCQAILDASGWMTGIVNRQRVPSERWDSTDVVWYDRNYYFLPESLFRDICEPIRGATSICRMKSFLAEAEILVMEGRSRTYGTVKVSAFNVYGERRSERRVKLRRSPIDSARDLTLIEMFGEQEEYQ